MVVPVDLITNTQLTSVISPCIAGLKTPKGCTQHHNPTNNMQFLFCHTCSRTHTILLVYIPLCGRYSWHVVIWQPLYSVVATIVAPIHYIALNIFYWQILNQIHPIVHGQLSAYILHTHMTTELTTVALRSLLNNSLYQTVIHFLSTMYICSRWSFLPTSETSPQL
jgi:hypothetical protein